MKSPFIDGRGGLVVEKIDFGLESVNLVSKLWNLAVISLYRVALRGDRGGTIGVKKERNVKLVRPCGGTFRGGMRVS